MSYAHAHPTVIPAPGEPVIVPPSRRNGGIQPTAGHNHQWVMTAIFGVDERLISECVAAWMNGGTSPGIHMDYDSLLDTIGPVCLRCQQPLNVRTAVLPCPVVLVPVLGVAN